MYKRQGVNRALQAKPTSKETAYCDAANQADCQRAFVTLGLVMGTLLSFVVLIEIFITDTINYQKNTIYYIGAQIICTYGTTVALLFWSFAKKYVIPYSLSMMIIVGSLAGAILGELGDTNGPFFYAIYILPMFIMFVPSNLRWRIFSTLAIIAGFTVAFLWQQKSISFNRPDITLNYIFCITIHCIFLGHRNRKIARERTLAMYRLNEELSLIHI